MYNKHMKSQSKQDK